jgi:tetratricopeptide (TPR) repeat protein
MAANFHCHDGSLKMKICSQLGIVAAIFFVFLSVNNATCQAAEKTVCQKVDELLSRGENQQAWKLLQGVPEGDVGRVEILWRMARTQYEMGRLAESGEQALKFFQKAEEHARAAMKEAPYQSEGYKWLAIALGAQAKYTGTETQVRQSREIKESIEKAIALTPEDDIAYLVLSRWHYKISELSFLARSFANIVYGKLPNASLNEAEELLLQAIELHDRISHRYNLGKVYDRMDRRDDARIQYHQALLLPVTFPEEAEEQAKARDKWQKRTTKSQ